MGPMTAWAYHDQLVASLRGRRDVEILTFADAIRYEGKNYPFTRVASRDIMPGDTVVVLRLSYHGDEPLGAMTFLHQAHRIIDEIHRRGAKFIAYVMPNPSGFELGTRDGLANNLYEGYDDWLRYELGDGTVVDELCPHQPFKRWHWSSCPRLGVKLSQETALMQRCFRKDLGVGIAAVVDVHEHCFVKEGDDKERVTKPGMYFYAFGKRKGRTVYDRTLSRMERLVPVLRNIWISAGYSTPMQTDDQGCIVTHDGSFADLAYRAGVPHSTVLEITSATPEEVAEEAVIQWIICVVTIARRTTTT